MLSKSKTKLLVTHSNQYLFRHLSNNAYLSTAKQDLEYFGKKKQTNVSLKSLMDTGKGRLVDSMSSETLREKILIQVSCFLHRELPIRLAHRGYNLKPGHIYIYYINFICTQITIETPPILRFSQIFPDVLWRVVENGKKHHQKFI